MSTFLKRLTPLTPRQVDCLRLLAEGGTRKSMARDMHVTIETVNSTVQIIYRKLKVHTSGAAVAKGFRQGLLK